MKLILFFVPNTLVQMLNINQFTRYHPVPEHESKLIYIDDRNTKLIGISEIWSKNN